MAAPSRPPSVSTGRDSIGFTRALPAAPVAAEEPLPPTPSPKRRGGDPRPSSTPENDPFSDEDRLHPDRPLPASGRGTGGEVASRRWTTEPGPATVQAILPRPANRRF